jgi:hypothetical protein
MPKEQTSGYGIFSELFRERPLLFQGVRRILSASTNPNKVTAINAWLEQMHLYDGLGSMKAQAVDASGEEPQWHSSVLVSRHKVDTLVKSLEGKSGGLALCVGSDVVFSLQNEPLFNLSRLPLISGEVLSEQVALLQQMFKEPSIARWDVAFSMSRKGIEKGTGLKVTAADVIKVHFDTIDSELVETMFFNDIPGALGRNTRIPLIDEPELQKRIIRIELLNEKACIDCQTGELRPNGGYTQGIYWEPGNSDFIRVLSEISQEIVGGMPSQQHLDSLLYLPFTKDGLTQWKMV